MGGIVAILQSVIHPQAMKGHLIMITSTRSERDANASLQARADLNAWRIGSTFAKPAPRRIVPTRPGIVACILRAIVGA